jgi:hypothetical protein
MPFLQVGGKDADASQARLVAEQHQETRPEQHTSHYARIGRMHGLDREHGRRQVGEQREHGDGGKGLAGECSSQPVHGQPVDRQVEDEEGAAEFDAARIVDEEGHTGHPAGQQARALVERQCQRS